MKYCLGFLFDPKLEQVVLIVKDHPEWQAGLLNGVGGKIADGESPLDAMVREFEEEAGPRVPGDEWTWFATLRDDRDEVFCFTGASELAFATKTNEKETIIRDPLPITGNGYIDNVPTLVELARYFVTAHEGTTMYPVQFQYQTPVQAKMNTDEVQEEQLRNSGLWFSDGSGQTVAFRMNPLLPWSTGEAMEFLDHCGSKVTEIQTRHGVLAE